MKVVFGLGSNLGSRMALVTYALDSLEASFGPAVRSRFYRSAALPAPGKQPGPDFVNAALAVETTAPASRIADTIRQLENRAGRNRTTRWADRTLDVDVLWASEPLRGGNLIVPHPQLRTRDFALAPLDDVAPEAKARPDRGQISELILPQVRRFSRRVEVEGALDEADAVAFAFAAAAQSVGDDVPMLEVEADSSTGFVAIGAGPALLFETTPRWRGIVGREGRGRWSIESAEGGRAAIGWISDGRAR